MVLIVIGRQPFVMNGVFKNRTAGPEFCRFGAMIRYSKEDLDKWIIDNRIMRS